MDKKIDLKEIILIGRTFDEYYRMFRLGDLGTNEKILDVASGVSSFCAEANARGMNVTASDRIYGLLPGEIEAKCASDLHLMLEKLRPVTDLYNWDYFKDKNALRENRENAYKRFLDDYRAHRKGRYIPVNYPGSPFGDKQFTVSLVSHFLFLYDAHLDYEFHRKAIRELLRITAKEIRIFPIVSLTGKRSAYIERLFKDGDFSGLDMGIEKVDYEFIKNGNEMLVMRPF